MTVYGGAKRLQAAGNTVSQIGASISFNPMPTLVTPEGFTFSSIGSFSIDIDSINQAIINGAQSMGINASMIMGSNITENNNNNLKGNEYKKPKSGSGKGKATDVPSWAKGNKPLTGESGKEFARRLMDEKYGKSNWSTGDREYS